MVATQYFPELHIRKIMKRNGAGRASEPAVVEMDRVLGELVMTLQHAL
jgi:histone H3/H4